MIVLFLKQMQCQYVMFFFQIQDFCDDDHTQGHYSHNVEPPNRHNRLCSHRSTWDVISNTPDFQGNANPPTTLSDSQLAPQFIIFRAPSRRRRRLAVILDSPKVRERERRERGGRPRCRFLGVLVYFMTEGKCSPHKLYLTACNNIAKLNTCTYRSSLNAIQTYLQNVMQCFDT